MQPQAPGRSDPDVIEEFAELARSAGAEVLGQITARVERPSPRFFIGSGKAEEVKLQRQALDADLILVNHSLSPVQERNLEKLTECRVVDRTGLILDIFAQRARSHEGKLQVELAQLKYSLPRLTEKDAGLSRLTGGIGGRGPGETVLEIGRRRIRDRIRNLEERLERLSRERALRRRQRSESALPVLSIIGYTNAGKSTLLNALTNSEVEARNELFVTLDPTSRRLRFPREGEVVITDTVGFIADLPKDLVTAFRATLEELADADLLLQVVDAADPDLERKVDAVAVLLADLELAEIPRLMVLNKADLVDGETARGLEERFDGVAVSAQQRRGLDRLIRAAEERLQQRMVRRAGDGAVAKDEAESAPRRSSAAARSRHVAR
ncbi:MAG TPA: GTPase HflX [Thermoanaerobaculia bacterium]|nr:GTPase HflX [Thermoanaerobaculia bacterium]